MLAFDFRTNIAKPFNDTEKLLRCLYFYFEMKNNFFSLKGLVVIFNLLKTSRGKITSL